MKRLNEKYGRGQWKAGVIGSLVRLMRGGKEASLRNSIFLPTSLYGCRHLVLAIYLSTVFDASFPPEMSPRGWPQQKSLHLSLLASTIPQPISSTFMHILLPSYNWSSSPPRTPNFTHIHFLHKLSTLPLHMTKPPQNISLHPFHYVTLHSIFTRSLTTSFIHPPILSRQMLLSDNSFTHHVGEYCSLNLSLPPWLHILPLIILACDPITYLPLYIDRWMIKHTFFSMTSLTQLIMACKWPWGTSTGAPTSFNTSA